jgi:hypothetical protein
MDVEATSFSQGWSLALSVVYFSLALMGIKNDVEATSFSYGWALALSVVFFSLASMGMKLQWCPLLFKVLISLKYKHTL